MQRSIIHALLITVLALTGACSDTTKLADHRVIDKRAPDTTADLPVDQALSDVSIIDRRLTDTVGKDVRVEKKPSDMSKDTQPSDLGPSSIYGTITRTATAVGDAKGELYVGVYMFVGMSLAGTQITADLSASGAKVSYVINNVPSSIFPPYLFAFLDDNSNATPFPFLLPDAGDLVMSSTVPVKITTAPQKIDIVLDKIEGSFTDGGGDANAAVGVLKGKVTATIAPAGDGKGPLYVSLHDQVPPAGLLFSAAIATADLSSPYASESYFISLITPGNYYLQAFLDDNSNNNVFAPGPDKGDMVNSKIIQLHIVGGVTNTQDVVLDATKP
jgi:hypothetical protein